MTTIDYAHSPRRPAIPVRVLAGLLLAVVLFGSLLAFAWLQFEISNSYRWLATHPNPPGASAWRPAGNATVRDVSERTTFYVASLEQVYDPGNEDATSRPPRNHRVKYRPALWLVAAAVALILAGCVAVMKPKRGHVGQSESR